MTILDRLLYFFRPRVATKPQRSSLRLELLEDRCVPALLGQQLFPGDNPWNQSIADAPVAANSSAIINNIIAQSGDGRLHPDFGEYFGGNQPLYGIPINVVHGKSMTWTNVVIDAYSDESDEGAAPIPTKVILEGDLQSGPRIGVNNRGDSHLIVWDADSNIAYEFYRASRPTENADGRWHADQQTIWDMTTNTFRTLGFTSADAAGLSVLAGLVRPDEALPVEQGGQGVINHAIRFTLRNSIILDQFVYPASHTANPGNNNPSVQPAMGARFRLKDSVDISQLNPQSRIVAQAMKDYGMIVADNGSNFYFSGASYAVDGNNQRTLTWNDDDIQDSSHGLKSLRFSDFEVVELTPAIDSLSASSASAGASVTIVGQNFGGAAGRLKVLFGATPSPAVTIVDANTIVALVPPGTGTVDVRIQSGVSTSPNADNVTNTIFGYGLSANTVNDNFTYIVSATPAPTVATPAKAGSTPVTGRSTTLSVLGADNAGEGSLTYTWSSSGPAAVLFSANGSNAAKNATATFSKAGTYTFTVTITNESDLSVTSSVTVTVQRTFSGIAVSPANATVKRLKTLKFLATALDQFDQRLNEQPTFTWRVVGKGTINAKGKYTAPGKVGGPHTIIATSGNVSGSTTVTIV